MKTYKLLGGGTVFAMDDADLVEQLNHSSLFGYDEDVKVFMKNTAAACKFQNGAKIRYETIKEFVEDLIEYEFVKEEKGNA